MRESHTPSSLSQSEFSTLHRWLERTLIAASVGFVLLFLYTALRRMHFPFSYDQVEGGMVTSVWRVAGGLPLYVKPSQSFVPFLYAPLYFYLAAALTKIAGGGYAALRLLSTLGTLGSFAVIFALVHFETRSRLAAFAGAGLYAACYMPLQGWFDMGRVDSLFVFVLLLALYCTRRAPVLLTVLVWLIAFQVKQTILPVAVLVTLSDWQRPRRMVGALVSLFGGFALTVAVANNITLGWYSFYLFGTTKGLRWLLRPAVLYLPEDILRPFGLAAVILLACLIVEPSRLRSTGTQFYLFVSFAIYASIWYLRAHAGSSANTLMPAYAWAAVLFGITIARLNRWIDTLDRTSLDISRTLLLTAAIIQIAALIYNPGAYIPSAEMRNRREAFERQLSALPGDVYVINHSYDAVLAGKQPHAVIDAFGIIQDSPPSPERTALLDGFHQAIDAHTYGAIVLDSTADDYNPGAGWMPADFTSQYPVRLLAESYEDRIADQPVERWIYLPCSSLAGDTSQFIKSDSIVSYGTCTHPPTSTDSQLP